MKGIRLDFQANVYWRAARALPIRQQVWDCLVEWASVIGCPSEEYTTINRTFDVSSYTTQKNDFPVLYHKIFTKIDPGKFPQWPHSPSAALPALKIKEIFGFVLTIKTEIAIKSLQVSYAGKNVNYWKLTFNCCQEAQAKMILWFTWKLKFWFLFRSLWNFLSLSHFSKVLMKNKQKVFSKKS